MEEAIVNKVAKSGLITLDLEVFYPKEEIVTFDLKDYLFMGLVLKEKEFREALKNLPLENYTNKTVTVTCSVDAIIPMWAFMLVAVYLQPVVKELYFGTEKDTREKWMLKNIAATPPDVFKDKRMVVKGCGDLPVSEAAYLEIAKLLRPIAKSVMYGEPCSTVPIYKKK